MKIFNRVWHRMWQGLALVAAASGIGFITPSCLRADDGATRLAPAMASSKLAPLTQQQKVEHALNRLGYGPRPGDVERVDKLGLERWIEIQLQPGRDDAALQAKLRPLKTLNLPVAQLMLAYEIDRNNIVRKLVQQEMRKDGAEETERKDYRNLSVLNLTPAQLATLNAKERQSVEDFRRSGLAERTSIQAVGELQAEKFIRAIESEWQLNEVLVDFWSNHFNIDVKKGPAAVLKVVDEREVIRPHVWGTFRDLLGASAKSPAMLVYLDNVRSTREYQTPQRPQQRRQQRQQQRPGQRQTQRNQNARNNQPDDAMAMPMPAAPARGGLNENYARELMELHTLGVDGGYSQDDVREVARCFTGWSMDRETGEFMFRPFAHDNQAKTVLGHQIPAGGGIRDGEKVLDILAAHPATAKHIAAKLCRRLVADEPPAALVEKGAQAFTRTGGDLQAVVRAIVTAPEFFAPEHYRAKIKSPFEYAVSAVRALDGEIDLRNLNAPGGALNNRRRANARAANARAANAGNGRAVDVRLPLMMTADGASSMRPDGGRGAARFKTLAREVATMGQPLYSYIAPTGYPEDSSEWVSTGALISRLNFALALTNDQIAGVDAAPLALLDDLQTLGQEAIIEQLLGALLQGNASTATRDVIEKQVLEDTKGDESKTDANKIAALIIGSPEFQRR